MPPSMILCQVYAFTWPRLRDDLAGSRDNKLPRLTSAVLFGLALAKAIHYQEEERIRENPDTLTLMGRNHEQQAIARRAHIEGVSFLAWEVLNGF